MGLRWEYFVTFDAHRNIPYIAGNSLDGREGKHGAFVREFASVVSVFQDRTDALLEMYDEILAIVDELAVCPYSTEAFSELLSRIQKTVGPFFTLMGMSEK
jgi:dynein heavy chain 1